MMNDTIKRAPKKRIVSSADLEDFLMALDIPYRPRLHINGSQYHTALLSVDFGESLEPFRLSNEQMHELVSGMRSLAREVLGREGSININTDNSRGVLWASLG